MGVRRVEVSVGGVSRSQDAPVFFIFCVVVITGCTEEKEKEEEERRRRRRKVYSKLPQ